MSLELHSGRPNDTTGRLEKEIRTYDLLDSLGISYERVDHEEANTMEASIPGAMWKTRVFLPPTVQRGLHFSRQ